MKSLHNDSKRLKNVYKPPLKLTLKVVFCSSKEFIRHMRYVKGSQEKSPILQNMHYSEIEFFTEMFWEEKVCLKSRSFFCKNLQFSYLFTVGPNSGKAECEFVESSCLYLFYISLLLFSCKNATFFVSLTS